ncbi:MAG: glycosyltransferase family 2 protein, partial [Phycisphaerae bacterium]
MSSLPSNNDISVIIVTYNSRDDILPCLNSLRENATPRRVQIIVIDNASTDNLYLAINAFRNSLSP